ncbi:MAG: two-component system, OmpR family, operon response regulator KdpE, partial [Chloroflexota bacterium]|nr:two-component system, OmpR family, operon response regulator KdpE [Chloroflexota bacterium]
ADDYVTKPCSYLELMARIKALIRRSERLTASVTTQQQYSADGLTIRFPSQEVEINGESVALTNTEYRLLYNLVRNAGRVVSHRALLQQAWGSDSYGADVVRVYVSRLRSKIESDPMNPRFIMTKPGAGYLFAGPALGRDAGDIATEQAAEEEIERRAAVPVSNRMVRRASRPGRTPRPMWHLEPAVEAALG